MNLEETERVSTGLDCLRTGSSIKLLWTW